MYSKSLEGRIFTYEEPNNVMPSLGGHTYVVRHHELLGFYLEQTEDFVMPKIIYGDLSVRANRVIKSFNLRSKNTGVLMTGEKGSGKTLLAKYISEQLRKESIPTILVTSGFRGDSFNDFMMKIKEPCVVIVDEFEKMYSNNQGEQDHLLTLLDGVVCGKKLFLLTCNHYGSINHAMIGRPGRILYTYEYYNLGEDFIIDYCNHNLKDKSHVDKIIEIKQYYDINFDVLQAIVQECNIFNEDPYQVMEHLNINKASNYLYFDFILKNKGKIIECSSPLIIMRPKDIHDKKTESLEIKDEYVKFHNLDNGNIYFKVKYDSKAKKYQSYDLTYWDYGVQKEGTEDEYEDVKVDLVKEGWSLDLTIRDYQPSNTRWNKGTSDE